MAQLLTAEQIAKRLSVQPSTVKRWSRAGLIPSIRVTGKVIRFDPAAVLETLAQHPEGAERRP